MERSALLGVLGVYIEFLVVEEEGTADLVALGCEVKQVHPQIAGQGKIGFVLLQALEHSDVALEGCVMSRS